MVADSYGGEAFHGLNDLCFDAIGNLFFTFFTDPRGSGRCAVRRSVPAVGTG
jgi:hypothetical protein